jgi:hypothetical protein
MDETESSEIGLVELVESATFGGNLHSVEPQQSCLSQQCRGSRVAEAAGRGDAKHLSSLASSSYQP